MVGQNVKSFAKTQQSSLYMNFAVNVKPLLRKVNNISYLEVALQNNHNAPSEVRPTTYF